LLQDVGDYRFKFYFPDLEGISSYVNIARVKVELKKHTYTRMHTRPRSGRLEVGVFEIYTQVRGFWVLPVSGGGEGYI
jgi:hypothetical protein